MTGFRAKPSLFQDLRHGDELDMEGTYSLRAQVQGDGTK